MVTSTVTVCLLIFVISNLHHTKSATTSSLQMSKLSSSDDVGSNDNRNLDDQKSEKQLKEKNDEMTESDDNVDESDDATDDGDEEVEEEDGGANEAESRPDTTAKYDERNCTCNFNSSCMCCIGLNLSFIDLGGPGCVKFLYMPKNDSMAVEMSYGQRLLQSSSIKRSASEATCMDLFSDLAQMCTKFTQVVPVQSGIKGCLTIEPVLLGVVQSSYNVGCFNMDEPGVQQLSSDSIIESLDNNTNPHQSKPVETYHQHEGGGSGEEEEAEDEEELAAAISQSAEDGLAWFNTLISSVLGDDVTNDTQSQIPSSTTSSASLNSSIES